MQISFFNFIFLLSYTSTPLIFYDFSGIFLILIFYYFYCIYANNSTGKQRGKIVIQQSHQRMEGRMQDYAKNAEAIQKCKSYAKNAEAVQECRISLRMQRLCSVSLKNGRLHSQNVLDHSIPFYGTFQKFHCILSILQNILKEDLESNSILQNNLEGLPMFHFVLFHSIELFHIKKAMLMLCLPSKMPSNLSILENPKKWTECQAILFCSINRPQFVSYEITSTFFLTSPLETQNQEPVLISLLST